MKQLSILLALVVCTLQLSFAQIKKSYKDKVFGQTTIVVKEDSIKDFDILSEFDLDEIGMDQIIQISTQAEKPIPINTAEQAITTTAEATVAIIPVANNPAPEKPKTIVLQQRTVDAPGKAAIEKESTQVKRRRAPSGTYRSFTNYPTPKNRRFKKKKRKKRRNSKRLKCFKF